MSAMASRKPSTASSISARTCASVSSASGVAQPISSISGAMRFMVAVTAARSSSVRSTMAAPSRAERVQKDWQDIEQNQTDARGRRVRAGGRFEERGGEGARRTGSNQPKPRVGRAQTAQSAPRGCPRRRRPSAATGVEGTMGHAALRWGAAAASISSRMARLLKPKVISAEAP